MVWSKACPRCEGDLVRMDDDYEPYFSCLQCGHAVYDAEGPGRGLVGASVATQEPEESDD
jgi:hypothetical protein